MSCLYSSPEVVSLEVTKSYESWIAVVIVAPPDPARVTHTESQRSSSPHRCCRLSRSAKTRSPAVQRTRRWRHHIIQPAKTSQGFSREFSSAISGFRSLCGRNRRSFLKPSRSSGPAFWNLSLGAGSLALRTLAFTRSIYGASNPGPMS